MPTWTKKKKISLWILAGVLVVYTLIGFVVAPMVIRHILEDTVSGILQRRVAATAVRVNPYTLSITVRGLSVADELTSHLITLDQVNVNAQISSIFRWALVVKSVTIQSPRVRIVRTAAASFNLSDLLEARAGTDSDANTEAADDSAKPLRMVLGQLQIIDGAIAFEDRSVKTPFSSTLSALNLTLSSLDTAPQSPAAAVEFSAVTESNETFTLKGRLTPVPLTADADMNSRNILLGKYAPYYSSFWNARLEKGRLDLSATAHWSTGQARVEKARLAVKDLELRDADDAAPLLKIPVFQIRNARVDLQEKSADIGHVSSQNGELWVNRAADGHLNWAAAMASAAEPENSGAAPDAAGENALTAKPAPTDLDWTLLLPELAIKNYRVTYNDLQPALPAQVVLNHMDLKATSLSTRTEEKGEITLSMGWNDQGTMKVTGPLGLMPLQADLAVVAEDVDIRSLQPYVNEYVGLLITSGRFNTRGDLHLKIPANTSPELTFEGQTSLVDFKSVDTGQHADFFNFRSLFLNGMRLGANPLSLSIEEIALTDFYNKIFISADGTANIQTIFRTGETSRDVSSKPTATTGSENASPGSPPGAVPETESTSRPAKIQIKTITLQGGNVDFSDLNVKPSVHLPMKMLGGRISGLDAIKENKADVLLEGKVGGNVPLNIKGNINPLIQPPFVNIDIHLTSVDLSPFTPYVEKYLGYELTKGQLAMDLTYLVEDNKLRGQNNAVLTQLTLGDAVSSPSATQLPIKLAIALLKDRNGNIDIDLPVKGDLNDPEFSIGGIVVKMLGNLILDIVTSPFKMLGAMFGEGEELSHIDFEPGRGELSADNKAKLDNLAKALYERPGLDLEIQGQVAVERDTDGLRKILYDQQLKNTKLKTMIAAGKQAVPLEQITISAEEKERVVRQAYKTANFPKPRNEKGRIKKLSPAEMEKILFTAIEITGDDLRQLAHQRALATKSYLLDIGNVEVRRLFIIEPEIKEQPAGENQKCRVQFSLK